MNTRASLVAVVLAGQLDAAGALADWLEDNGEAQAGVLLRRRWQRWRRQRIKLLTQRADYREAVERPWANLVDQLRAAGATVEFRIEFTVSDNTLLDDCDELFARYVRERFAEKAA